MMQRKNSKIAAAVALLICGALIAGIVGGCAKTPGEHNDGPAPTEFVPTPVPRDTSADTPMSASMVFAGNAANSVQAYYTTPARTAYTMENLQAKWEVLLAEAGSKGLSGFASRSGNIYFSGTMDTYVKDTEGNLYSDRYSPTDGYINTTRLGYYYYETHLRDLTYSDETSGRSFKAEYKIDTTKNWNAREMSMVYNKDGSITAKVEKVYDPYFFTEHVDAPASEINAVSLTISATGNASTIQFFFYDSAHDNFNAEQMINMEIYTDGQQHTYIVELPGIKGMLKGIRLDYGKFIDESITLHAASCVYAEAPAVDVREDRTYHIYPDKIHQEFRIISASNVDNISEFGMQWIVPEADVNGLQIRDAGGTHSDTSIDPATVEYVGFDFKSAGVAGIIIPNDEFTERVTVERSGGNYIVRQIYPGAGRLYRKSASVTLSNRLYCDDTHDFAGLDRAAVLERYPLEGITVNSTNAGAKVKGYDTVRGMYMITCKGSDFNTAYYKEQNKYYQANVTVANSDSDRTVYMCMAAENSGCIECSVLLDGNGALLPMGIEVCKNFSYEKEEPFYDPQDSAYGNSIFPLVLSADGSLTFDILQLYQNWGGAPLKQLSSIQFFVSYYHLSTGVTESNCIAPYYVYGKDGWTLPDFRGPSGIMWSGQPQFNAGGCNRFMNLFVSDGSRQLGEYTGTRINSSGPAYADAGFGYIAENGEYKYTLRHMEFPQTDENRTYYTLEVEFLKDLTVKDAWKNFALHCYDTKNMSFRYFSYLDANGTKQVTDLPLNTVFNKKVVLNRGGAYFSIYGQVDGKDVETANFGFLLKDHDITVGGKAWDGNFCVNVSSDGKLDYTYLCMDADTLSFKKGDRIRLRFILMPWGTYQSESDENVVSVYEDSILNPLTVTSGTNPVSMDDFLPRVTAVDNSATFTVSGSRNNNVVRIDGFMSMKAPLIERLYADGSSDVFHSADTYDGYEIQFNPDGTYSISFVFETDGTDLTFRVSN